MSQAVWTGSISFGLVTIPVKLYPATEPKDVRFHLYDRRTGKRVRYQRVTRDEDAPVFEPEADMPEQGDAPEDSWPRVETQAERTDVVQHGPVVWDVWIEAGRRSSGRGEGSRALRAMSS